MPYKFETLKLKLGIERDRRRKLTELDKEEIKWKYGNISQRELARQYGVSRRLIQFIGNPKMYEKAREQRKENGKEGKYYEKERHKKYMKKHRLHKKEVFGIGI